MAYLHISWDDYHNKTEHLAVKVHEDEVPQIVVAIASPTGLEVNSILPIADTPVILIATQIPVPKKNNKTVIKKIVKKISSIGFI